jgi:hypothetical protein
MHAWLLHHGELRGPFFEWHELNGTVIHVWWYVRTIWDMQKQPKSWV